MLTGKVSVVFAKGTSIVVDEAHHAVAESYRRILE
jgi:superfamily II DNA or RNA helicase